MCRIESFIHIYKLWIRCNNYTQIPLKKSSVFLSRNVMKTSEVNISVNCDLIKIKTFSVISKIKTSSCFNSKDYAFFDTILSEGI